MILNLCFAILPVILISACLRFFVLDRHKKFPLIYIVLFLVIGGITAALAYSLESWMHGTISMGVEWYWILIDAFLVTSAVEEILKLVGGLIFFSWLRKQSAIFCILAFVFVGLGFSLVENVIYAMSYDWITMAFRSITALPSHAIYGVVMGALTAKAIHSSQKVISYWAIALILPTLIHGLYDWFILQDYQEWLILGAPVVLILTAWFSYKIIRWNQST